MYEVGGQVYWGEEKVVEGWGIGVGVLGRFSDFGMLFWKYLVWQYCYRRRFLFYCRVEDGKQLGGVVFFQV